MLRLHLTGILIFFSLVVNGQFPPLCGSPATLASTCATACLDCNIDGATFRTSTASLGQWVPELCTGDQHHFQFVGFVAGSTDITFDISVYNCANPTANTGLEIAVFESLDCNSFTRVSNCDSKVLNNTTTVLTATGLTPGQHYWFIVDGNGNSECDFDVTVTSGSTDAPIPTTNPVSGPDELCDNLTASYSTTNTFGAMEYEWFLDGTSIDFGLSTNVNFPGTGTYDVCVEAINACESGGQKCMTVEVTTRPTDTRTEEACFGNCVALGGMTFCTSGNYTVNVSNPANSICDSLIDLTVVIRPLDEEFLTEEICEGLSFTIYGNTFSTTGNYTINSTNSFGCPRTTYLDLTVNPAGNTTVVETICEGSFVIIGGVDYDQTGIYPDILLQTLAGCDSLVTLDLTVNPAGNTTVVETICEGDFVTIGGVDYDQTGIYPDILLQTIAGCDSLVTLDLTVVESSFTPLFDEVCDGNPSFVGGQVFYDDGYHEVVLQGQNGCDSIVGLDLTVKFETIETIDTEICEGDTLFVGFDFYTDAGLYFQIKPGDGNTVCDTFVDILVDVIPRNDSMMLSTLCFGDSIQVDNQFFDSTGNYQIQSQSINGCDRTIFLDLQVLPALKSNLIEQICEGDTFRIGNLKFDSSGLYNIVLPSSIGCDSTVSLDLTVDEKFSENQPRQICEGDSVTIGNMVFDSSGIYDVLLQTIRGCDSLIQLNLTVVEEIEANLIERICDGESFQVGSQTFDQTGNYQVRLVSQAGCDSLVNLDLSLFPKVEIPIQERLCFGDSLQIGQEVFDASGQYDILLQTAVGCDSLVRLDLEISPKLESFLTEEICFGKSYLVDNQSFTQTGDFQIIVSNSNGCDSTVNLDLTVLPEIINDLPVQICDGQTYQVGNQTFNQTGIYDVNLSSQKGCDSLVRLDLKVLPFLQTDLKEEICEGDSFQVGTQVFDQTGQFRVMLQADSGCDSIVELDLKVNPKVIAPFSTTICFGENFKIGNQTFDQTGMYDVLLTTSQGCDSLVQIDLTVLPKIETNFDEEICFGKSITIGNQTFNQSGNFQVIVPNPIGCDTTINLNLTVLPEIINDLPAQICDGKIYQVGNEIFDQTGIYDVVLNAQNGCDSLVRLNLTVENKLESDLPIQICDGQTYTLANQTFTTAGQYPILLSTADGCDSIVNLDLSILPFLETDLKESICEGAIFEVGNEQFNSTGFYQVDLKADSGCDSIVRLDLTVIPLPQLNLNRTICFGDSIAIGGQVFDQTGTFDFQIAAANGCDTIAHLELVVEAERITVLSEEICDSESYQVDNQLFTQNGIHEVTLPSSDGCDSLVRLDLLVNPTFETNLTESICPGESFQIGNQTFSQPGQFSVVLTSEKQCDSLVNLNLSVTPCDIVMTAFAEKTKCFTSLDGHISVTITGGLPPFEIFWDNLSNSLNSGSDTISNLNEEFVISDLGRGEYLIVITDPNGIELIEMIEVESPDEMGGNILPSQYGNFQIKCHGDNSGSAEIENMFGGTPPYEYEWSTGKTDDRIENLTEGQYDVVVLDANGCQARLATYLNEPDPIDADFEIINPGCDNPAGNLAITEIRGGIDPVSIILNGENLGQTNTIDQLEPGTYVLIFEDTFSCKIDTIIVVPEVSPLTVDIGDYLELELGDSIQFLPITNRPPSNYSWQGENLSCDTCSNPVAHPLLSGTYKVHVIAPDGCVALDELFVRVDKQRNIYVPSAFSPNNDGINDFFTIFSDSKIQNINRFQVFSRWGELVFENKDFQPNVVEEGWGGLFHGQPMDPAVFVWYAEIEFIYGGVVVFEGEVSLVR